MSGQIISPFLISLNKIKFLKKSRKIGQFIPGWWWEDGYFFLDWNNFKIFRNKGTKTEVQKNKIIFDYATSGQSAWRDSTARHGCDWAWQTVVWARQRACPVFGDFDAGLTVASCAMAARPLSLAHPYQWWTLCRFWLNHKSGVKST